MTNGTPDQAAAAQTQRILLENEKLRLELAELRKLEHWSHKLSQTLPLVTAVLAIATFLWGVRQYEDEQKRNRQVQLKQSSEALEQSKRDEDAAKRSFMQPWLQSQRETYARALSAAASIANTRDPAKRRAATEEFWILYHGSMIPVETKSVSGAMINFGHCVDDTNRCSRDENE